jgi:hypothetical protein
MGHGALAAGVVKRCGVCRRLSVDRLTQSHTGRTDGKLAGRPASPERAPGTGRTRRALSPLNRGHRSRVASIDSLATFKGEATVPLSKSAALPNVFWRRCCLRRVLLGQPTRRCQARTVGHVRARPTTAQYAHPWSRRVEIMWRLCKGLTSPALAAMSGSPEGCAWRLSRRGRRSYGRRGNRGAETWGTNRRILTGPSSPHQAARKNRTCRGRRKTER